MYVSLRPGSRFRSVYRHGSRRTVEGIVVFQASGDAEHAEVGFVAGKKVGNAVARNRAKRRLRAAVRDVHLVPDAAYIFVANRDVLDVPFGTLVKWVGEAAGPAGESRNDRD